MPAKAGSASSIPNVWYYVGQERVSLPVATNEIAVRFAPGLSSRDAANVVAASENLSPLTEAARVPVPELTLLRAADSMVEAEILHTLNTLRADPGIAFASPVFALPNARMTVTDQFVAQFREDIAAERIAAYNEANGVECVRKMQLPNTCLLRVARGSDVLAMANIYHESELTTYANPDFLRFLSRQFAPDDTYYPHQWGMENTGTNPPDGVGTPDADLDMSSAWDIERGSSDVIIAIIDEGTELDHEDLNDKIVSDYSTVAGDTNGAAPNSSWDAHGTACAGIAAAETDNGQGVAGVCAECSIMAVQIAYSIEAGGAWVTQDSWIADAMTWAVDHGADVLSNSWGGGTPSMLIDNAIDHAVVNGRNGLGCPVLFASGNKNTSFVNYPGSSNQVIAVGASSPCDERKTPNSCDGESSWGSQYGSALDIVAPGVEWWATDLMGWSGYASGNYFDHMNGTSSATPAAAGVAGLLLSLRPCLNEEQVQGILQESAEDQVGPPDEDTPGWDRYMGWGRINAQDALQLADDYPCGSGCAVSVQPPTQEVDQGEEFTTDVKITDVPDLGGFEFDLSYDPTVVHVLDVVLGPFPGGTGRTWFEAEEQIDNSTGLLSYAADSYGPEPGVTGTGIVATVSLEAQNKGDASPLELDRVHVTDTHGIPIDLLSVEDGSVEVISCTPVSGADFWWSNPVRTGRATTFTGTIGGGTLPLAYDWDFGDTSGGSGEVVAHTYDHLVADTHGVSVHLDVTNDCSTDLIDHMVDVWLLFDFDMDCDVDIVDIMDPASRWSCESEDPCYDPFYDVDLDGDIDVVDIMQTAAHWDWSCP
jgi:hypothetical protein